MLERHPKFECKQSCEYIFKFLYLIYYDLRIWAFKNDYIGGTYQIGYLLSSDC